MATMRRWQLLLVLACIIFLACEAADDKDPGEGAGGKDPGEGAGGKDSGDKDHGKGDKKPHEPPKPPKKVRCSARKAFPFCSMDVSCPYHCPQDCYVDCPSCKPVCVCNAPGAVCQDPRFIGGDGITFYFHGQKGRDFCLVSDPDLHINAHFIGKRGANMTRDFTWVQAIAVLFDDHRLYISAQKTATWDDAQDRLTITFDDEPVDLPGHGSAKWLSSSVPALSVNRTRSANAVIVGVEGRFTITANVVPITEEDSRVHRYDVTPDDCLAHLELGFKFYSLTGDVHGVLGQTYREDYVSGVDVTKKMPVMGGAPKFSTSDLFAADCAVARFGRRGSAIAMVVEQADAK